MIVPAEGHVIAGKYRLERPLSRGGMGSVWVARHLDLGMPVAVKLMDPLTAARPEWRQRFAREAKAAGAIQSPHVVKVHDYGVDAETPYLVMELLSGEDLGARLKREGRLSLEATARLALSIAKGLKRAHEAGVVHRDLKPANVFLARVDEDEIVQILDFGIAKVIRREGESDRTETGVVMGSIHYMSPEQARGFRDADHRADVWSLGVIVYRALTGELPFPGQESGDVLVKVCTDPAPSASARLPMLDGEVARKLDRLVARALAKSPAERFQTARDLADSLCAVAGIDTDAAATTTGVAAMVLNTASPDDVPTRTEAIPALSERTSPEREDPGTTATSRTLAGPTTGPSPAVKQSRAAWTIGVVVALAALGAALVGLSYRGTDTAPSPAAATASARPAETGAVPATSTASAGVQNTASSTALNTAAPTTAPTAAPSISASAAASTAVSAAPPGKSPPPAGARPAPKPGDRVKEKFGF